MRVSYDTVFVFAYTNNVYYRCVCVYVIYGPRPVLVEVRWPPRGELGVELVSPLCYGSVCSGCLDTNPQDPCGKIYCA